MLAIYNVVHRLYLFIVMHLVALFYAKHSELSVFRFYKTYASSMAWTLRFCASNFKWMVEAVYVYRIEQYMRILPWPLSKLENNVEMESYGNSQVHCRLYSNKYTLTICIWYIYLFYNKLEMEILEIIIMAPHKNVYRSVAASIVCSLCIFLLLTNFANTTSAVNLRANGTATKWLLW